MKGSPGVGNAKEIGVEGGDPAYRRVHYSPPFKCKLKLAKGVMKCI